MVARPFGGQAVRNVLAVVTGGGVAAALALTLLHKPALPALPALPPPPTIEAPSGEIPTGIVSFEERVDGNLSGSGFLLRLPGGEVVGVTSAHSLPGRVFHPWELRIAGRDESVAIFRSAYAPVGMPRPSGDLTGDYALGKPDVVPDSSIVLHPDPRGAPMPGERVSLYSGVGSNSDRQRILQGTTEWVHDGGVWIRMDATFDPTLTSGSPIVSQHTGKVVGITIAMRWNKQALRIGANPIRSIVAVEREN